VAGEGPGCGEVDPGNNDSGRVARWAAAGSLGR